jgi:RHS repeat-associated protein
VPTANSDNQLTGTGYTFDGNGNPTTYGEKTLTFDPENRMTGYGSVQTNTYGADSLRASSTNSGATTYFLYDNTNPVVELNSSGTVTAINTFSDNGLLARDTSADEYYAFDPQGSTAEQVNSSGGVDTSLMTDAFGKLTESSSFTDPFGGYDTQWGYYTDASTGLQLLTYRFYDPLNSRFITRDPIDYAGGEDLYSYVADDAVGSVDPDGYQLISIAPIDIDPLLGPGELAPIEGGTDPVGGTGGGTDPVAGPKPGAPGGGWKPPVSPLPAPSPIMNRPRPTPTPLPEPPPGHRKPTPSKKEKHEKGDGTRRQDRRCPNRGGEKGDKRRPY